MKVDIWVNCDIGTLLDELSFTAEETGILLKQAFEYYATGGIPTIRDWDRFKDYILGHDPLEAN